MLISVQLKQQNETKSLRQFIFYKTKKRNRQLINFLLNNTSHQLKTQNFKMHRL